MSGNELNNLIFKRRSVRLFNPKKVPPKLLKKAIDAGRLAPSAANLQFIEYLALDKENLLKDVFLSLKWAGYLYPRKVPPPGARPVAYIVILINKDRAKRFDLRDVGAAAENIMLSLLSFGVATCWLGSVKKRRLKKILNIPSRYLLDSVIALGFPAESPRVVSDSSNVKYWLEGTGNFYVPKRPLKEVLHYNKIVSK
ncbi:MAG: nitroreductase [Candidatus Omnitrophica bacterium]|nr:nitroreductase [Candidatus Omnitrophota bacterium]MBD3269427.1 nitroreductase [Candidatus Omnitrophota bacterium]